MSTDYGRAAEPDSGNPRRDSPGGQATAETPVVPPPRAGEGRSTAYTGSHRTEAGYPYETGDGTAGSVAATGFTWLAASVMLIGGLAGFFTGLEAVARGNFYLTTSHYLYDINITSWGWIHIVLGGLVFLAGCALFARQNWARVVGVVLAVVSAVMNFLFIPRYPLWAIVVIALDVVIIWALTAGWRRRAY